MFLYFSIFNIDTHRLDSIYLSKLNKLLITNIKKKENYQNLHPIYVLGETKVRSTGLRSTMEGSSHLGKNWYCPPTYLKRPPPNGKLSKLSKMFLLFKEKYEKFSPVVLFLYFFSWIISLKKIWVLKSDFFYRRLHITTYDFIKGS